MYVESQGDKHIIVLKRGEKLVENLTRMAKELDVAGGTVSGIGALEDVELGYYDLEKKEYLRKTFSDSDYELISLLGNVSLKNDEPYVHVHASLGDSKFNVFGGHLFEATVAVTAEIYVTPFGVMPSRKPDSETGLDLICGIVN